MAKQEYIHMRVPLLSVNVLPQVRKTFDEESIEELANDIAVHGILQPSICGLLSPEEMQEHLDLENRINKTDLRLDQMISHQGQYLRLIAGERRYRAHMFLYKYGCTKSIEEGQTGKDYYLERFGSLEMEIRACVEINAYDAKSIQFRENNHKRPPLHEEAYSLREAFDTFREFNESYTMKALAEFAGMGIEKIRRALAFTHLPEIIRSSVESGLIKYGHAIEFKKIAELEEEQISSKLLMEHYDFLLTRPRLTLADFRNRVMRSIELLDQTSLFDQPEITSVNRRRVVAQHLLPYLTVYEEYLRQIKRLKENGLLGRGKVFSGISPNGRVKNLLSSLEELIPGFKMTKRQIDSLKKLNLDN